MPVAPEDHMEIAGCRPARRERGDAKVSEGDAPEAVDPARPRGGSGGKLRKGGGWQARWPASPRIPDGNGAAGGGGAFLRRDRVGGGDSGGHGDVAPLPRAKPASGRAGRFVMDCRETQALLTAFHDGELPAADRARVEAHLRGCPECRARQADLARADQAAGVPDPGPAYWDRFNARVMDRIARDAGDPGGRSCGRKAVGCGSSSGIYYPRRGRRGAGRDGRSLRRDEFRRPDSDRSAGGARTGGGRFGGENGGACRGGATRPPAIRRRRADHRRDAGGA